MQVSSPRLCFDAKSSRFFSRIGIGKRTLKTALAVLCCLLLGLLFPYREAPLTACIAAILTMQATQRESFWVGGRRLIGTAIGGGVGMAMLGLYTLLPFPASQLILATLGVMASISICCFSHLQEAAALSAIVVLGIVMASDTGDILVSTLWQMGETAVGVVLAVAINYFVARPKVE